MEQYGADYTFSTPKWSYGSYSNYFMFVVKSSEKDGLLHNGNPFPKNTTYNEIAGTNYVAGYISIPEGTHVIKHESPISVFGGYLYGVAEYETYGFPTGMRMASINAICINTITVVGDGLDNDCDGKIDEELCTAENNGFDDDGDGISDEDCAYPLPIDGVWGSWGSWSTCSVTCGSGQMLRSRNCSDPYPNYGGQPCSGNSSSFTTCNVKFASQCPSSSCLTVSFPVLTVIITVLSVAVPLAGFII